jgi:circadian clock protein KaiB
MIASEPIACELTLFVSGASGLSAQAIAQARQLCDSGVGGECRLSVVDVHQDPESALSQTVIAAPTLIKSLPLPARRYVGDLSRTAAVLVALDLPAAKGTRGRAHA